MIYSHVELNQCTTAMTILTLIGRHKKCDFLEPCFQKSEQSDLKATHVVPSPRLIEVDMSIICVHDFLSSQPVVSCHVKASFYQCVSRY